MRVKTIFFQKNERKELWSNGKYKKTAAFQDFYFNSWDRNDII